VKAWTAPRNRVNFNFAFGLGEALFLGIDHDDELAPAGEQFVQLDQRLVRQRARRRAHRLGEMGDHPGVAGCTLAPSAGFGRTPKMPVFRSPRWRLIR
jgi:hypothetical protein